MVFPPPTSGRANAWQKFRNSTGFRPEIEFFLNLCLSRKSIGNGHRHGRTSPMPMSVRCMDTISRCKRFLIPSPKVSGVRHQLIRQSGWSPCWSRAASCLPPPFGLSAWRARSAWQFFHVPDALASDHQGLLRAQGTDQIPPLVASAPEIK